MSLRTRVLGWLGVGAQDTRPELRDDDSLVVVGGSGQAERADSEVLAELAAAGVDVQRPLLVRHHLVLPDELAAEEAARLVADEGYRGVVVVLAPPEGVLLRLSRVEVPTGLTLAQERSRMAGLAQRLGGDTRGWDLLAPPGNGPGPGRGSDR